MEEWHLVVSGAMFMATIRDSSSGGSIQHNSLFM